MKEETGYFSSFDGTKLFYRAWDEEASNALVVLHGIGEHSGRYRNLIESLSELPLSFFLYDARGHGHSEGERVYINSFSDLVEDACHFRRFIEERKPARKRNFILMGQSLGGLVATAVALKSQADWRALVLLSPFFGMTHGHSALYALSSFLNAISSKMVWNNPIKPIFLTHDQKEVETFKKDPLIQRKITSRMAHEMFRGCASIKSRAKEISLPLLLLYGGDDHISSAKEAERFFERTSSSQKQIKIYPRCFHELLHEIERDEVATVLKEYLFHLGL